MTAYDASQIEVLHGLEPVRRRPGMFLGATEQRARNALAHLLQRPSLLWQLGESARREALLRRPARLERAGDEYVYEDPVPLPAARHPKCGTRAFELALTSLHGGYVWEGTCGLAILNGGSRRLEVETSWRGRRWRARFVRGEVLHPAEDVGVARGGEAGLRLRFELDPAIAGERPDDPVARALA
ncbi:MAG TPA: hypothetical protein RMH26_12665, partial [Polyangiaceae bacterium LLY-WYZ-15_(1-7)]|nr:hypothetical protein [Polyangiaceae bacterium LLY-WYZ-15_(1-7)]